MLIEALNLSKSIGAKDLFHDLSFTVDNGEKIALIGRNGQGKTTILKMLAGEDSDYGGVIKARKDYESYSHQTRAYEGNRAVGFNVYSIKCAIIL
jgi:ABC transport system ATP-binding/permease protein